MADHFTVEARCFVDVFDRLGLHARKSFLDFPEPEEIRPLVMLAQFFNCQKNNPLRDFDLSELLVIDFAGLLLAWVTEPTDPKRWAGMFAGRANLHDYGHPWEFIHDDFE